MQLDRTEIVVRARSALELFDLSLQVLKRHGWEIAVTSALFGVPLLVLDGLATAWILNEDTLLVAEQIDSPLELMRWRHFWHVTTLFLLQFPLISLPTTVYLGNRIFYQDIPLRTLMGRLWPIAGRCLLILGVLRLGLVGPVLELFIDRQQPFDFTFELWFFVIAAGAALFTRALRPFAPEILGLELCPLRSSAAGTISYRVRSRALHRYTSSENIPRFLGATFFGTLLFFMLIAAQMFVIGAISGHWSWNAWFDFVGLPLSLWAIGLFLSVFRYLSYVDNRIRLEGWEIENRLKAEAARLEQPYPIETESKSPTKTIAKPTALVRLLALACFGWGALAAFGSDRHLRAADSNEFTAVQRAARSLPINNWYDKQTGEFVLPEVAAADDDPIRTHGNVVDSPPPTPPTSSTPWNWNWSLGSFTQWLPTLMFAVLATGLLILLGLLTYYSLRDYMPQRRTSKRPTKVLDIDPARMVDLPFEPKPTGDDPLSAAERAMQVENYGDAIAYLYGYMLLALDQSRLIHLQKGKTNRMYMRELGNRLSLRENVERAMLTFEASYFGKHRVTREQFLQVWEQVESFHEMLQAASAVASKSSAAPARTKLAMGWLLTVTCVAISGCGRWLPDELSYGAVTSPEAIRSLNGLGLYRKLWEARGAKCLTPQRLSPRLNNVDVIVLVGQSLAPPGIEARQWLENWLARGTGRTVIYFGRDFSADIFYRQRTLARLSDSERTRGQELIAIRQADELQSQLQQLPEPIYCDWFYTDVHRSHRDYQRFNGQWSEAEGDFDTLLGGWPVGIALQPPDSQTWRRKLIKLPPPRTPTGMRAATAVNGTEQSMRVSRWHVDEFGSDDAWRSAIEDSLDSEILLAADDGTPLVFQLTSPRLGDGQILVAANGFPFLNGSLVTPLGAQIGALLLDACPPAGRVALLAFDQRGLTISKMAEADQRGAGLEMLTVWPLSAITMPAALLGIIACAAWWPIVGRPQSLAKRSISDFGLHVEAIGSLMMETRDSAYASEAIQEYFRKVRGDEPPAWLSDIVSKE
ncbi:MAG: DUF4129 domain-containing protein [Aureliella sp.]